MSTPTLPLQPKPRAYRRFLTSALHTRFVHAALLTLVVALNTSFCLGPKKGGLLGYPAQLLFH